MRKKRKGYDIQKPKLIITWTQFSQLSQKQATVGRCPLPSHQWIILHLQQNLFLFCHQKKCFKSFFTEGGSWVVLHHQPEREFNLTGNLRHWECEEELGAQTNDVTCRHPLMEYDPYSTFPSVSSRPSTHSSVEVVLVLELSISGCLTLSHCSRADQFNL